MVALIPSPSSPSSPLPSLSWTLSWRWTGVYASVPSNTALIIGHPRNQQTKFWTWKCPRKRRRRDIDSVSCLAQSPEEELEEVEDFLCTHKLKTYKNPLFTGTSQEFNCHLTRASTQPLPYPSALSNFWWIEIQIFSQMFTKLLTWFLTTRYPPHRTDRDGNIFYCESNSNNSIYDISYIIYDVKIIYSPYHRWWWQRTPSWEQLWTVKRSTSSASSGVWWNIFFSFAKAVYFQRRSAWFIDWCWSISWMFNVQRLIPTIVLALVHRLTHMLQVHVRRRSWGFERWRRRKATCWIRLRSWWSW